LKKIDPSGSIFFVYILQSFSTCKFYIGHCDHLIERFYEHEAGYSAATRGRGPWWMPYFEVFATRGEAMKREAQLKRMKSHARIKSLILRRYPGLDVE
jgi:putative endonuclease